MREASSRVLRSLFLGHRQEFVVVFRLPRERIDAEEPKYVIDAKQMKYLVNIAAADAPPIVLPLTRYFPFVERNPPILSPLLGEWINFEVSLGWTPPTPVEIEDRAIAPHVGTVAVHTERDVAHEVHFLLCTVFLDLLPLVVRDPLHIRAE